MSFNRGSPFIGGHVGGFKRKPFHANLSNHSYYGDLFHRLGAYGNGPFDMHNKSRRNFICNPDHGCCYNNISRNYYGRGNSYY